MNIRIPTWNPLRVHRESWLQRLLTNAGLRHQHFRLASDKTNRGRHPGWLPRFKDPESFEPAPGPQVPVEASHADGALRWNALGLIHGARQSAITKLKRIDVRLIKALGRCTVAEEKEGRAYVEHERVREGREAFLAGVPDARRDELERHSGRLARLVPAALWGLETTIMIGPWHLFGAPPLPFLSYDDQTAMSSMFALLRAALLSLVLIASMKLAGSKARMRVGDHEAACRTGDVLVFLALAVTTVLLVVSTATMQGAYIAIATGGFGVKLPTSIFLMVTLFVIVASVANGYWTCTPRAERHSRLVAAEKRSWQKRERAAKELDRRETAVRAIAVERGHLLSSLRELENEQLAYEQRGEAVGHHHNWVIHGLEDLSPKAVPGLREVWSFDEMPGEAAHDDASRARRFPREPRETVRPGQIVDIGEDGVDARIVPDEELESVVAASRVEADEVSQEGDAANLALVPFETGDMDENGGTPVGDKTSAE